MPDDSSPLSSLEDPIKVVDVAGVVGKPAGRSDALARRMRNLNYKVVKAANRNYCQRADAIAIFSRCKKRIEGIGD